MLHIKICESEDIGQMQTLDVSFRLIYTVFLLDMVSLFTCKEP